MGSVPFFLTSHRSDNRLTKPLLNDTHKINIRESFSLLKGKKTTQVHQKIIVRIRGKETGGQGWKHSSKIYRVSVTEFRFIFSFPLFSFF